MEIESESFSAIYIFFSRQSQSHRLPTDHQVTSSFNSPPVEQSLVFPLLMDNTFISITTSLKYRNNYSHYIKYMP